MTIIVTTEIRSTKISRTFR